MIVSVRVTGTVLRIVVVDCMFPAAVDVGTKFVVLSGGDEEEREKAGGREEGGMTHPADPHAQ